jgi:excisionase family DNA binding protein
MSSSPHRGPRRPNHSTALFVRIPTEQARRLDRASFELKQPKQELVSGLLERYLDEDARRRQVIVETIDAGELQVGHYSFRKRSPDVLTSEEAAELLQVEPEVVEQLAQDGELPARRLGDSWRFARQAILDWLADPAPARPEHAGSEPARSAEHDR